MFYIYEKSIYLYLILFTGVKMRVDKIVNLTPHPIKIIVGDKSIVVEPTSPPARLQESTENIGSISINGIDIPVIKKYLGNVSGVPEPVDGVIYIVSLPVASAMNRKDVLAIGESIRDEKGNVIGAKSLSSFI